MSKTDFPKNNSVQISVLYFHISYVVVKKKKMFYLSGIEENGIL